jgi:hypothetical protein
MPTPDTTAEPEVTEVENSDAPVISDDQLDAKRTEVEQLRAELEKAQADRLAREQAKANANVYTQLDAEGDRLRAMLAAARGEQPDVGLDAVKADEEGQTAEQVTDGGTAATGQTGATDPNTAVPGGSAPDAPAAETPKAGIQFDPAANNAGEGE